MSRVVLLDTGPLGQLANPNYTAKTAAIRNWVADLLRAHWRVVVPEIADYEVRRELIRHISPMGLKNLDWLGSALEYLPLTTNAMRLAADLWAQARSAGRPTAPDPALDADMILCAQCLALNDSAAIVATGNPAHIARFAPAVD